MQSGWPLYMDGHCEGALENGQRGWRVLMGSAVFLSVSQKFCVLTNHFEATTEKIFSSFIEQSILNSDIKNIWVSPTTEMT